MIRAKLLAVQGNLDGNPLNMDNTIVISSAPHLQVDEHSGYQTVSIKAGEDLRAKAQQYAHAKQNYLVLVDTSFTKSFNRLSRLAGQQFGSIYSSVFVLATTPGTHFTLTADQEIKK